MHVLVGKVLVSVVNPLLTSLKTCTELSAFLSRAPCELLPWEPGSCQLSDRG